MGSAAIHEIICGKSLASQQTQSMYKTLLQSVLQKM